jgi:hypothetical protein
LPRVEQAGRRIPGQHGIPDTSLLGDFPTVSDKSAGRHPKGES